MRLTTKKLNQMYKEDFDQREDRLEEDDLKEDPLDDPYDDTMLDSDIADDFYGDGDPTQSPMEKHNDLLKELTSFSPYLKETFNSWLGVTWNEVDQKYTPTPGIKPIMNIKGVAWCIGFIKTYTRGNNILTHINKENYDNMMEDIIDAIWLNLGTRDDLGIKNDGDLLRVAIEIEHAAALALMGAGDGKYSDFLKTTVTRNENVSPGQQMPGTQIINAVPQQQRSTGLVGKFKKMLIGSAGG